MSTIRTLITLCTLFVLSAGCIPKAIVITSEAEDAASNFDYDGRTYEYKTIGSQTWMTENLAYLPFVSNPSDGSEDDGSEDASFYYVYDYKGSIVSEAKQVTNYETYGVLYNWEAAKTACPPGWHLPSDNEWKILEKYLGMRSSDVDKDGLRYSGHIDIKLKSTSRWERNKNRNNSFDFQALPGGNRTPENIGREFNDLGDAASFWSSTPYASSHVWCRHLYNNYKGIDRYNYSRNGGFSVRCIRN